MRRRCIAGIPAARKFYFAPACFFFRRAQIMRKIIFSQMACEKIHSRPPKKILATWKCEKSFFADGLRKNSTNSVYEITHLPVIGVRGARVGGACQPILQLPASLLIHLATSQPVHQSGGQRSQPAIQPANSAIPGGLRLRRTVISSAHWLD